MGALAAGQGCGGQSRSGKRYPAKPRTSRSPQLSGGAPGGHWGYGRFGTAFREAIRIDPGVAEWHDNLAKLLASRGNLAGAAWEFEQSIAVGPEFLAGRLDYAKMLANTNHVPEAEAQVRAVLARDPNLTEAHELLGYLLSAKGDLAGATRELQLVIRRNPQAGRPHYELGLALGRMGQHAAAAEQLRAASMSSDPQARAAALEVLRRLGQ